MHQRSLIRSSRCSHVRRSLQRSRHSKAIINSRCMPYDPSCCIAFRVDADVQVFLDLECQSSNLTLKTLVESCHTSNGLRTVLWCLLQQNWVGPLLLNCSCQRNDGVLAVGPQAKCSRSPLLQSLLHPTNGKCNGSFRVDCRPCSGMVPRACIDKIVLPPMKK